MSEPSTTKTAYFDRFFVELPEVAVEECSHQGACDSDVKRWREKINLSHINSAILSKELKEYGSWSDEELKDRINNEERIIWIAACNIKEEERLSTTSKPSPFDTTGFIIEFEDGNCTEEEVIEGFQHLIDTGLCWQLQGSYGRTASALIQAGHCTSK